MAAPVVPAGYLYCDGRTVSRATYAALFNVVGTRFGAGDGSTTFSLPDWRGAFMRGWDDGRGVDSARVFGSVQQSQNKSHIHSYSGTVSSGGTHSHNVTLYGMSDSDHANNATLGANGTSRARTYASDASGEHSHSYSGNTSSEGGSEARPINNTVYVVVKF